MATETRHAVILRVLAEPDHKDGGGMRWHPSGEPNDRALAVSNRIVRELDAPREMSYLDGLGNGSVVLDNDDDAWQYRNGVWILVGDRDGEDDIASYSPFRVLYATRGGDTNE